MLYPDRSHLASADTLLQEWGLDVTKSSFLSGLPWALSFALANLAGWTADTLINNQTLTTTQTRKLMQGIASLGPAACLTALCLQPSGPGEPALVTLAAVKGVFCPVTSCAALALQHSRPCGHSSLSLTRHGASPLQYLHESGAQVQVN